MLRTVRFDVPPNLCSILGWLLVLWWLASYFIEFQRFSSILQDLNDVSNLLYFYWFRGMEAWDGTIRHAAPFETFARFQAGFLSSEDFQVFVMEFHGFHRFEWIPRFSLFLYAFRLAASCPLRTYIAFRRFLNMFTDLRRFPNQIRGLANAVLIFLDFGALMLRAVRFDVLPL